MVFLFIHEDIALLIDSIKLILKVYFYPLTLLSKVSIRLKLFSHSFQGRTSGHLPTGYTALLL